MQGNYIVDVEPYYTIPKQKKWHCPHVPRDIHCPHVLRETSPTIDPMNKIRLFA